MGSVYARNHQQIRKICTAKYVVVISLEKFHDKSNGVTPVHLAIVQGDVVLLKLMAKYVNGSLCEDEKHGKCAFAIGEKFQGTGMMAGTLLGIASLMTV